ncbi:MAG: RdgB/HAM1 family non-canonical purine NTP pyrophosphatase [Anaerolineaceae bacterium]
MKPSIKLLLGTNNPGKIREMSSLLSGLPIELVTPAELNQDYQVEEIGSSYLENAACKARAWAQKCGTATLADDSGLEVDVLDGAPGLYSHRFTGDPHASDEERRRYLVKRLQDFPRPWLAHFTCVVAIATPGQELVSVTGTCYGEIIPEERGSNGFGYDAIFLVADTGKTMAELNMQEKNQLSHRAQALRSARPILINFLLKGK